MTILPPSPFITDPDRRFVLDEDAFMAAVDPMPVFLRDPSPEYLTAADLAPITELLTAY